MFLTERNPFWFRGNQLMTLTKNRHNIWVINTSQKPSYGSLIQYQSIVDQPQLIHIVPTRHSRSKGRELPTTQTIESHSYASVFMPKCFSLGIHMTHITHKADIHIPGDWLEPLLLGDLNIITVTTMAIALKRHVIASVKT